MNLHAKILSLELKSVALAKVHDELLQEQAELKKLAAMPAPAVRQKNKVIRMQSFEDFYTKRKIR